MNGRNPSYKERSADRDVEEAEEQAQKGVVLASMKRIVSNMAGVVLEFLVKPGEKIVIDQDVIMLESMKMQIPVQSTVEGTVRVIKVNEGDFVDDGDVLLEVE